MRYFFLFRYAKTKCPMRQVKIDVLFDRRKLYEKKGFGYLEVRVYFARIDVRYITVCESTPQTWEEDAKSKETLEIISQCNKIIAATRIARALTLWMRRGIHQHKSMERRRRLLFVA